MAINKAKVAIGFMVAGVLVVILGTVITFVGPIIIDDQVVKVSICLVCALFFECCHCGWRLLRFCLRSSQHGYVFLITTQ